MVDSNNIKICFLANGNSIHNKRWINYFLDKNYTVYLITFHGIKEVGDLKKLKIYNLKLPIPKFLNYLYFIVVAKFILFKIRPDVIHSHYLTHYGLAGALFNYAPFILTLWGSDILLDHKNIKLWDYVKKYVLNKADIITCDAEHFLNEVKKYVKCDNKIKLVHFGTDVIKFKKLYYDKIKEDVLKYKKGKIVISLRSLGQLYDVETLIKATPLILKNNMHINILIAGDGPQRTYLEKMVSSLHIEDDVTFLGYINNDDLPAYLSISDIYVSTSLSDAGLSASTAEAMACQLPVVVTNFGDNSKWVVNHVNGFIFPCKDYEQLAQKILYLLNHEEEARQMGENNRKLIIEKLNYYTEFEKMDKIYRSLAGEYNK